VINDYDKSGSCAIIVIIMDDVCYIANLGDSRALYSESEGRRLFQLTRDHKPNDANETKRIEAAGGSIYQGLVNSNFSSLIKKQQQEIPFRIMPGRLSVIYYFN